MKIASAFSVSFACLIVGSAGATFAQPRNQEVAANDPLRENVQVPAPPADLVPRVERLRAIASKTIECYSDYGERSEHVADRRCPRWFAQLEDGGVASAFAIGGYLVAPRAATETNEEEIPIEDSDGAWQTGPRLIRLLGASDEATAAPFLVAFFAKMTRGPYVNVEIARATTETLARVSGNDVSPVAPWDSLAYDRATEVWRGAARDWLSWWHGAAAEPRDKWLADGTTRARAGLTDADPLRRFASIQRLAASRADRVAVRASYGDLVARPDLPANVRAYIVRYGRRHHLPAPARSTATLAARATAS